MKMLSVRPCPSCGAFKLVKLCRIHFMVKRYGTTIRSVRNEDTGRDQEGAGNLHSI